MGRSKNYLFIASVSLLLVVGYWFFSAFTIVEKSKDITSSSAQQAPRAIRTAPPTNANSTTAPLTTKTVTSRQPTSYEKAQADIPTQTANQQLELERQKLELQQQTIQALKNRRDLQLQQMTTEFPTRLSSNSLEIQNLLQNLQNQRLAANDISEAAAAALNEQNSAERAARDRLDFEIQNLEQSLRQTSATLSLGSDPAIANMGEEVQRMQTLQNTFAQQTQELALLKDQRLNLSAYAFQQTRNINALSQAQKNDLIESQNSIQQQISSLRNENGILQQQYSETRMSLMPLSQQISQAEQAYQESLQKVKSIEQSSVVR